MATILIVDDRSADRVLLLTLLGGRGHQLLEAADGEEGLAAARAKRPDLIITDVLMPVMDGYELVKQLRFDEATRAIPVVFYTAHYGAPEARALALAFGISDVLTKPAEATEAMRVVDRVLSGQSGTGQPSDTPSPSLTKGFDREHLRLLPDPLSETTGDLRRANARLRAVINIGLELASEPDADSLLARVCVAAQDLFGATFVTLGILDPAERSVQRIETCGTGPASWIQAGDAVPGIFGTVVAERRTLRGHNPGGDPVRLGLPPVHPEIRAFLAVPIASASHVYGWICLAGNEGRTFTDEDEQLAKALSGQVGRIYGLAHEIRERTHVESDLRHEEEAQRASETRYRTLFEYAPDGMVIADGQSNYIDANPSICRMLGYSHDELVGLHASDIVGQAEVEHIAPALHAIKTTLDYHRVWQFKRKDRSVFSAEVIATPMPDGNLLGVIRDVTERNQAVEALRTTEERMRFALENAHIGIWDMDYATGVLRWSETLEAQYGLSPGTFAGTFEAFVERIHPDDRESAVATVADAMKTGRDFSVLNRALWPDGTVRWLSGAGRILVDEHGAPVRGVGISQDVTERKQADKTRARLAAIVDSSDDAIFSTSLDGTIVTWNSGAERLYKYTASEAIGRNRQLIVPVGKRDELIDKMAKAARGEPGETFDTQRTRKDGATVDISLTMSPLTDSTGCVTGVSTIGRDITSRKEAEAEVQRLNDEIQHQRLRVFRATIRTVQDIVNNLLNSFQLVRLEGEGHLSAEVLELVDGMIADASVKLRTLAELETVSEKEMVIGLGIHYPGAGL